MLCRIHSQSQFKKAYASSNDFSFKTCASDDFLIRETHIDMAAVVHKPDLSPLEKRIRDLEEAVGKSHQGEKDAESVRKWGLL